MSADTPTPTDPHGIVPEGFCDRYGADSITEALREAEAAPVERDRSDAERCPACPSTRIRLKRDRLGEQGNRREEDWKCLNCGAHFEEPRESKEAAMPGEQVGLEVFDG